MRATLLAISCLVAGALYSPTSASERAAWNRPEKPFHVVGNVYYAGMQGVSSFLITSPSGSILLDAGLPESARSVENNIGALGFKLRDIKYLLNSHAHFDHAGGLAELKRATGAQLLASRGDAPTLEAGRGADMPPVKVDRIIDDGATVELGGIKMTAVVTPGHTKGCTTCTMPVTEAGATYRVVFFCSTSVVDSLVNNRAYPGIVADYRKSFARLLAMPCDVFLAPHGNFFRMEEKRARIGEGRANPFIDAGEMHVFIENSQADFERRLKAAKGRG